MDPIAALARNLFFPLLTVYEKSSVRAHLKRLEESQYFTPKRIREIQLERLQKLLKHAHANCPFYQKRLNEAGLDPNRVRSPEDLSVLPVLTKRDIQNNLGSLRAANLPEQDMLPDRTGGSTGSPLNFFVDRERYALRQAAGIRHDRWAGWNIGDRSAYLWGHREDFSAWQGVKASLRNWLIERRIFLDTSSITVARLAEFTRQLRSFRPKLFVAYANSMYLYARYLSESGTRDYHRPAAIITSAELLESHQRELIEKVFQCRVFDRYGCREVGMIGSECEHHQGLHVCAEAILVETISGGKSAPPDQAGKIIVTDLMNFGMPFIRYQIEDVGSLLSKECACGRGLPLMSVAGGRITDFLVTPDGRIISGASLTIYLIANTPGIAQAQFVQEKKDEIILRLVPGRGYGDETTRALERQLPDFFGPSVSFKFDVVDHIPLSASGKHRFSISKLDPSEWF